MKQGIHPDWHHAAKVTCSCGNEFEIGSVQAALEVDICNKCHPFFTGEVKFVDRQGRVDRFKKQMAKAKAKQAANAKKKKSKAGQSDDQQSDDSNKSYRDLLREQKSELRKQAKQDN